ncbi:MAG: hypothetical protein IPP49_10595 [Saprospiraceae bacterium]|nr:hypothetical protein [Saprospiraceae bacterium]
MCALLDRDSVVSRLARDKGAAYISIGNTVFDIVYPGILVIAATGIAVKNAFSAYRIIILLGVKEQ